MTFKAILKYWFMYYAAAWLGWLVCMALTMFIGSLISFPMVNQQHVDLKELQKQIAIPLGAVFVCLSALSSFVCFRWVMMRVVKDIIKGSGGEKSDS